MKVALELGRNAIGIELNPKYAKIMRMRVLSLRENDIILKRLPLGIWALVAGAIDARM